MPTTPRDLVSTYDEDSALTRSVAVLDLEIGDYLCHPDTGDWWTLGEEPTVGKDPDTTTLVLRNVYDGERETTEVPSDAIIDVRDLAESHLAAIP
jgi:hypothetical protein